MAHASSELPHGLGVRRGGVQGQAYLLLEQYSQAEQAFLAGLAVKLGVEDPVHVQLQQALRQVSSFAAASR